MMFLSGCSKPDLVPGDLYKPLAADHVTRLREIEDPFNIQNIRRAYQNLQTTDSLIPAIQIQPNYIYIRFLPSNESEMEMLKSDTTLTLYDYPLNSEAFEGEINEHSADVSWQYCVVPFGKNLPSVRHEEIYDLFIPPDEDRSSKSDGDGLTSFYDKLVDESARITGNLADRDTVACKSERSSTGKWNPAGRIRVWDDLLQMFLPLNHVNVHARWFTRVETCLTGEDGYFRMKSFNHKVNYSVQWENSRFTIRNGLLLPAWYNGPKMKGDWMLDIAGGKSKMFATIHRAAYRQFYGNNLGMSRPTLRSGGRTKICYMDGKGTGTFIGDFSCGGILPDIQIWGNGATELTNMIFGTVSHELGHQLHSEYVGNIKFMRTSKIVRESWAEAVEWAMTNDEYHQLGKKYGVSAAISYDHQYDMHIDWPLIDDKNYSPVFIDLIDSLNQHDVLGVYHPDDLISGYTISYINEYFLKNSTDILSLKQEVIKHPVNGVDDYKIREFFLLYLSD